MNTWPRVRRGDMLYADLNPYRGSEQGGIRPVVVLQNDVGNRHSSTVIVAPTTTRLYKSKMPTHVVLEPGGLLRSRSMVLLEQLRTIDRSRLREPLGCLDGSTMARVDTALQISLGLAPGYRTEDNYMEKGKRAWIYTRIDAPEDAHGALKLQEKSLYDYAEQMGFTVVGSSSDLASGTTFDRPGLKELSRAVDSRAFDILLVRSMSRIGREVVPTLDYLRSMTDKGIGVFSPLEGELNLAPGTLLDALYTGMGGMAQGV